MPPTKNRRFPDPKRGPVGGAPGTTKKPTPSIPTKNRRFPDPKRGPVGGALGIPGSGTTKKPTPSISTKKSVGRIPSPTATGASKKSTRLSAQVKAANAVTRADLEHARVAEILRKTRAGRLARRNRKVEIDD
jgi:hypothetical protein